MPQLDFTTYSSQFFWLVISFVFLFGITSGYFLPKFYALIANRKKSLDDESAEIEDFKKKVDLLVVQRKQQIDEANAKVDLMIKQAVDHANQLNNNYEKKINQKAETEKKRLKESLEAQKADILKNLESFVEEAVAQLLLKIENQADISEPANKKNNHLKLKNPKNKKTINKSL